MKKTYIQPSAKAYNVENGTVLAGSDFSVNKESNSYTSDDFGAKQRNGVVLDEFDDEMEY